MVKRFDGIQYPDFLERTISLKLEDIPLNVHEGVLVSTGRQDFSCKVRNWLNNWTQGLAVEIRSSDLVLLSCICYIFSYGDTLEKTFMLGKYKIATT